MGARRWFASRRVAPAAVLLAAGCGDELVPAGEVPVPPVSTSPGEGGAAPWVDVFVGTGDANVKSAVANGQSISTFPGAAMPFGMVQFSPHTPSAAPPGYHEPDDSIVGFSMTHPAAPVACHTQPETCRAAPETTRARVVTGRPRVVARLAGVVAARAGGVGPFRVLIPPVLVPFPAEIGASR
jgi:hypothetical protein